jgi:GNAT superfamily N-acetyltransferase
MEIQLRRSDPSDPDFAMLTDLLDLELWERNPDRQSDYVVHNALSADTRTVVACSEGQPVGSGAFRKLDTCTAEIKRMFVREESRGQGISKLVLAELENWAREVGCNRALIETGMPHFEAISLYKKTGYKVIENYGPYKNLPNSVCMEKWF